MKLNNGLEIPQIGVGTWTLRGETARQNVRLALQAGFRHVDTAQMYENESEVEAWGPFGQGNIDVIGHPLLQSLAAKYEKTASQIVLRWIVQRDLITIPRAKPNHFAENLAIMTFTLSDDDMQAINALNQNLRSNELNDPEKFPW
jgi:diketogulonate reductase-like aldo/keto reductase